MKIQKWKKPLKIILGFFKNGQFLECPKKNFSKIIFRVFFKEIKYYKDFVKNEWGFYYSLWMASKNPPKGDEKSFKIQDLTTF